ncbi:MAG TPA: FtsL-like putative cell division protein [Bacteroidales bacterium]|nr:FtsL-like putative cell division protein [Bacteroidales bacterium]
MAENEKNTKSIWQILKDFVTGKVIQELDVQKTTQVLVLVAFFAFLIIANTYHGQKQVSKIENLKKELKELKFQYTVTKAGLIKIRKRSSLEKALETRGLVSSKRPPQKIEIEK